MSQSGVVSGLIWEDSDVACMARIKLNGAVASFVQASIASVSRKIFDRKSATPSTAVDEADLTVATVVFDTLQTDGRWTKDATGYNFRDTIAAADLSTGGSQFRVEYKFTTTGGSVFFAVFELTSQDIWSS